MQLNKGDLFMTFDLSHIEFSPSDEKRKIILPTTLDEKLAELIGIIIGDGHLGLYYSNTHIKNYEISVVGHLIDDKEYMKYVNHLFFSLFNFKLYQKEIKNKTVIKLRINSKAILFFLNKCFRLPLNKKSRLVKIPDKILESSLEVKRAFLRGLADTDFSFSFKKKHKTRHYYPVIKGTFASSQLISDLSELFNELNLKHYITNYIDHDKRTNKKYNKHSIFISGKENFYRWAQEIGFSNYKHILKRAEDFPPFFTF